MNELKLKLKRIMNLIFFKYSNNKQITKKKKRNKYGFPSDLDGFK